MYFESKDEYVFGLFLCFFYLKKEKINWFIYV